MYQTTRGYVGQVGDPRKRRDFLFDLYPGYDFGVQHERLRYIASENIDEEASAYNVNQRGEWARARRRSTHEGIQRESVRWGSSSQ